jgi:ATP-binding protein involved in chromosome partitioning
VKIAVPLSDGLLCQHFGHCETFALFDVSVEDRQMLGRTSAVPPAHAPGVLPRWLQEQGVNLVLAGGMGSSARTLCGDAGIQVVTGVPSAPADEIVRAYLDGTLTTGVHECDH